MERVKKIAAQKGCSPSQLALAWVMAQGADIVPIPGTKRRKYLDENVAAVDIVLTKDEIGHINDVIPVGAASGTRYPESAMPSVNR